MIEAAKPTPVLRILAILAKPLAILVALGGVQIAAMGITNETVSRVGMYSVAVAFILVADVQVQVSRGGWTSWVLRGLSLVFLIALAVSSWRYLEVGRALESGLFFLSQRDILLAYVGIVTLLYATWRVFGMPLLIVVALSLLYVTLGKDLPGLLRHSGFGAEQLSQVVWYGFDGAFGTPLAVVISVVLIYVVFGAALEAIGAGETLIKLSFLATGRTRGGPAHGAVVASGLFGTLSGSAIANIVGTGVITMPMIKKRGFPAKFAGAVEAAASNGGSLMPPVMGVVAFVMADVTGIPYITICLAALVPALLYYGSLFAAVHVEAVKRGIQPMTAAERPVLNRMDFGLILAFVVPLAIIIGMLLTGRSPSLAGFAATVAVFVIGCAVSPLVWREPRRLVDAFVSAGQTSAQVIVAVAAVGVVIGVLNMTGVGLRLAGLIAHLAGDNLFLGLLLMAAAALIMGMGLPVVPAYLIVVVVMGPAISALGVSTLVLHLFVVYYAVMSSISPPVALAAFAAAPIAGANPMAVGFEALRLSVVGLLIPFLIVEHPALTIVEGFEPLLFVLVLAKIIVGIWMLTTALAGYAAARTGIVERLLRLGAAVALLMPGAGIEALGVLLAIAAVAVPRIAARRATTSQT